MDTGYFPIWLTEIEYLFWLGQGIAFLVAAIYFYRADRRHHTLCFLIGSSLCFILVSWQTLEYSWIISLITNSQLEENSEAHYNIQSAMGIVGNSLMAYGIIMIGLIAFRKSLIRKDAES